MDTMQTVSCPHEQDYSQHDSGQGFFLTVIFSAVLSGKMFVFDGLLGVSRTVKLRHRQVDCVVCGQKPSISALIDYHLFCGASAPNDTTPNVAILTAADRISCQEYHSIVMSGREHILIDVRPKTEFAICHLDNSISILAISIHHSHSPSAVLWLPLPLVTIMLCIIIFLTSSLDIPLTSLESDPTTVFLHHTAASPGILLVGGLVRGGGGGYCLGNRK